MAIVPDTINAISILIIGGIGYYIGHSVGKDKGIEKSWDKDVPKSYKLGYNEAKSGKPSRYHND